jgi:GntR family carbon starvation induced transcriptional regulator
MRRNVATPGRALKRLTAASASNEPKANETLGGLALTKLRADIVAARWKPGDRLTFDRLRSRYGLGIGPLREALSHLVADGLVMLEQQRGYSVAPVSLDDLRDVTAMRQHIDALALGRSIELGDLDWEARIVASFHRLSKIDIRVVGRPDAINDGWEEEHRRFHEALISACGSPILIHFHQNLFDRSERYRRLSFTAAPDKRDVAYEHQKISDAALARDSETACRLIHEHIGRTATAVELMAEAGSPVSIAFAPLKAVRKPGTKRA